jgi:hypothetical protein
MKLKSLLAEALTPVDKKAVEAFFDGKPFEGKNLNSDGKTLKTVGIGSQPMYTHTPNGVKMVGKVTGGYSQSLVQYVNKVHKGDLGEARIPNNSTSARMNGLVSNSNINNLFKVVEPLIKELSDEGFELEEIVGFVAKRIEAKFSGLYEGITEAAGIEAMGIAGFTGTRGDAVQKFIDDNNLDAKKLFAYIKGGKLKERMGFVSAIAGTPGNKIQKELISKFKLKEGIKEVKYPTDLKVGSVILGQGFTALKGIEGGKYYKVVEMDDTTATLVPSDNKGNVKGTKKVRHKLSSIEGGIKTAKRGDENGIVVI